MKEKSKGTKYMNLLKVRKDSFSESTPVVTKNKREQSNEDHSHDWQARSMRSKPYRVSSFVRCILSNWN